MQISQHMIDNAKKRTRSLLKQRVYKAGLKNLGFCHMFLKLFLKTFKVWVYKENGTIFNSLECSDVMPRGSASPPGRFLLSWSWRVLFSHNTFSSEENILFSSEENILLHLFYYILLLLRTDDMGLSYPTGSVLSAKNHD